MQQYFSVLELDEMNTAGSLGIGNVLTEYNKVTEAKEIFKVIANSETDQTIIKHAMLNHAHLLMNDENNEFAINLYQAGRDKFPDDVNMALYLAKAHFRRENYDECQKMTVKLMMRHPNDMRLKFNLALCLYERAKKTFELSVRRVKQTENAIKDLKVAKSLFNEFISLQNLASGNTASYLIPSTAPQVEQQMTNQTYKEMYRAADQSLTYLNEMLQQSEWYLSHDRDKEAVALAAQYEKER